MSTSSLDHPSSTESQKAPTPAPHNPFKPETTGTFWGDFREAVKHLNEIQCARNSLLSGIASGAGLGIVRGASATVITGCHWALGTFMVVSVGTWAICRNARMRELRSIQTAVDGAPQRRLKAQTTESGAEDGTPRT
ncbi:hypothetical protein PLICRDRAFT_107390 [Plicaturopsis crispa FD-325 SS-3]|nr:hypothetical protein PLICRDRAFT_107390 [Plicaturopsis crispa FD-325 SS-3]